ncbi:MAG: glycosyltransferase family 4 protein [Candidatus Gastranaerophilales bacterium]|nr:glycosyltransferase family 4 protein [Candidatus Gastranaerophilales bacterium]MCM1072890.1 glycosyltransferase family 4 protein [Bacteroides sp.]
MKLLFDCTELSYFNENSGHRAGVFYVALNLYRELKKQGIDITFICDFKRYYFMKNIKEFQDIPLLKENSFYNKLISRILYLTDKFPIRLKYAFIIFARFYDKYFYRVNKKNLKQLEEFDAYFSPFTPPSKEVEISDLKRFRMIHDIIPILENGMPKTPKDWHYKIYRTVNDKDFYLTNSECTKKDVLRYFPFIKESHIKTTLLGANNEFYPIKTENKDKYIFSLCTLGKRKNLIFGIKNFFAFIEKHNINDLKLVLGGGVWKKFEKELDAILNKYDQSKIILTGYIKEKELRNYFSNALCFIYPSLYEGFGLPVLEAMQCGCPVITSNVSSLPEVIGNAGIQINPESDKEMIEAYEKMYFDNDFRETCSKKGLERAKDFSWENCASELLEFIKTNCI